MENNTLRYLSENKEVILIIMDSTELVEELRQINNAYPVSIAALGRTVTAASIISNTLKNEKDRLTIRIKGTNEIKSIIAVSKKNGDVKGYISNPIAKTNINKFGKLDVGGAIGKEGELFVIKDYGLKEPYVGTSKLVSGEIAEDLAYYFMSSEQQPTVFSLGVFVNSDGIVESAGGLLIQTLPNVTEESLIRIENSMKELKAISTLLREEKSLEKIIEKNFSSLNFKITNKKSSKLFCDCSYKRMKEILYSVGKEELKSMLEDDKGAEIQCHFCKTNHKFSKEDLSEMISKG